MYQAALAKESEFQRGRSRQPEQLRDELLRRRAREFKSQRPGATAKGKAKAVGGAEINPNAPANKESEYRGQTAQQSVTVTNVQAEPRQLHCFLATKRAAAERLICAWSETSLKLTRKRAFVERGEHEAEYWQERI